MVISQVSFCSFCRRRTLEYLRRAVYCRDEEARARLTRMATAWAELAPVPQVRWKTPKLKPARSTDELMIGVPNSHKNLALFKLVRVRAKA